MATSSSRPGSVASWRGRAMRPHMPTEPHAPGGSARSVGAQTARERVQVDTSQLCTEQAMRVEMMLRAGKGGHRSAAVLEAAYERRLVATPPRTRPRTTGSVRALHLRANLATCR